MARDIGLSRLGEASRGKLSAFLMKVGRATGDERLKRG
jgi:hypothetical protein